MYTTDLTNTQQERILLSLSGAVVVVGGLTLHLGIPQQFGLRLLIALLAFGGSTISVHIFLSRRFPNRDPFFVPIAALLVGLGLLTIARVAVNFLLRQSLWLLISSVAFGVVINWGGDLHWLRKFRYTWLFVGLIILALTLLLGVNPSGQGPRLWLGFAGVYFQPSELLKLLMIVYLSSYLADKRQLIIHKRHRIGKWRLPSLAYLGPLIVMFGIALLLLVWQQDLGAAMLFFFTFLAMLYLSTHQWVYVAAGLGLFLVGGLLGYVVFDRVALRVDSWLDPWVDAQGRAYQIVQSLLAFGAGGIFGEGLGMGVPTFIPAVHTDFVFAAVAEELGLFGTIATVALYTLLAWRGIRVALRTAHPFKRLLAAGLTAGLTIQAWIIMSGNAKLAPLTGVTLPFMSYGGSSLLITFLSLGLLTRISCDTSPRSCGEDAIALRRLFATLALGMFLLSMTLGYWSIVRAPTLRERADNPRRVLYEQRIARGRILDGNGVVLADTTAASDGTTTRTVPVPEAAPAIGYASLRYGTSGIESAFDAHLRGEAGATAWETAWRELLHRPPEGDDVTLTLDATLQRAAQERLKEEVGALILIDAETGEIITLASSPTFDPEQLDQTWETLVDDPRSPLLNRATQGLYQPGTALQTVILAEALQTGEVELSAPVSNANTPLIINGAELECISAGTPDTLAKAYAISCPAPFAELGTDLGADGLAEAIESWQLDQAPELEIPTESADWSQDAVSTTVALEQEATGQGALTVSPMQMARVAGAIANEGALPSPTLVLQAHGEPNGVQTNSPPQDGSTSAPIEPHHARSILRSWRSFSTNTKGHLSQAIAGEGERPHVWFLGIAPIDAPRYAIVVLLEHAEDASAAADIGSALLETIIVR